MPPTGRRSMTAIVRPARCTRPAPAWAAMPIPKASVSTGAVPPGAAKITPTASSQGPRDVIGIRLSSLIVIHGECIL